MSGSTADIFVPEVAQDAIVQGISDEGIPVLYGSRAVSVSSDLASQGQLKVGRTITVPYFGMIPAWQEDVPEKVGLAPEKATETTEEATMKQGGIHIEWSTWEQMVLTARSRKLDPFTLFAEQARMRLTQMFERKLVTTARTGLASDYINDISGTSPGTISWDAIADTRQKLGDASSKISMMSMHSKVHTDAIKLKDGEDRPLFLNPYGGGDGKIPQFQGIPTFVSDFNYKSSASPPVYDTLLMQDGAMALWHTMPTVEITRDSKANMSGIVMWIWYIVYRYSKLPGGSKPGVLILRSK